MIKPCRCLTVTSPWLESTLIHTLPLFLIHGQGHEMFASVVKHHFSCLRGACVKPQPRASNTNGRYSIQIKFYLVTHNTYYVHFITSVVTEEIL